MMYGHCILFIPLHKHECVQIEVLSPEGICGVAVGISASLEHSSLYTPAAA